MRAPLLPTLFASFLLCCPLTALHAQTWDGVTPAEELVCDGLPGREFGLCNAYCEALDCDSQLEPAQACDALRDNFYRATGSSAFPCDVFCVEPLDPGCSGNGDLVTDTSGCSVCECDEAWSGADCATCDAGFDNCGVCGGPGSILCD